MPYNTNSNLLDGSAATLTAPSIQLNQPPCPGQGSEPAFHEDPEAALCKLFQAKATWAYIYGSLLDTGKVNWLTGRRELKPGDQTKAPIIDEFDGRRFVGLPLTNQVLISKFKDVYQAIGKRFGRDTDYFLLDIDRGSRYHPGNSLGSWRQLLGFMEDIGFARPIAVTSSKSNGIHIYFPLTSTVKSWRLASFVTDSLKRAGYIVKDGELEVFPNKKADPGMLYKGHRLPLQLGSYILDLALLEPRSDSPTSFVAAWQWAVLGNEFLDLPPTQEASANYIAPVTKQRAVAGFTAPAPDKPIKVAAIAVEGETRPTQANQRRDVQTGERKLAELRFTDHGQTNWLLGRLAILGADFFGLVEIPSLAKWMGEVVCKIPGFNQFVSQASKLDIMTGWCARWAKSKIRSLKKGINGIMKAIIHGQEINHNQVLAQDFEERLDAVLAALEGQIFESGRKATAALKDKGKELFGKGFGNVTLMKCKPRWSHLIAPPQEAPDLSQSTPPDRPTRLINGDRTVRLELYGVECDPYPEHGSILGAIATINGKEDQVLARHAGPTNASKERKLL